jgi:hypothetical protein
MLDSRTGPEDRSIDGQRELPPAGVNVIVQCDGLRCMAYRTRDGKWMTTFTHEEIKHVIRYFPLA